MAMSVPLMMGNKIIGRIQINEDTGEFTGAFVQEAIDILREGMKDGIRQVTVASIYGLAAKPDMSVQERWSAYLKEPVEREYWRVRDSVTGNVIITNLNSKDAARNAAINFATSNTGSGNYTWERQNGPESAGGV